MIKLLRSQATMILCAFTLLLTVSQVAAARDHYFGDSSNGWGKLKTKVQPADASVWIDGKYVGHVDQFNGPGQELYLSPGEHEVTFSIAFYKDHKMSVTAEPNKTVVIEQQLARSDERIPTGPFANVKIKVRNPDKAAVLVNDRFIGHVDEMNGPAQWLLLEPGHYKIEIRQAGYKPFEQSVDVKAGAVHIIRANLEKDSAVAYAYR